MTIEIELKFIATPQAAGKLAEYFSTLPHQHQAARELTNIYFETDDNQLRRWDMGLRIRGIDKQYEMTLKAAGQTLGGLHQRPEYNVELSEPVLDIARLPATIWPQGTDVAALQSRLQPLFTTHFQREIWLITAGNSEIEVAFDQGEVSAGEFSEPLCEVELELKRGERQDLLTFAQQLVAQGGLRMGSLSKAARGYQLAQGNPPRLIKPFPLLKAGAKATVEQGMVAAMSAGLSHWQYHEEVWLRGNAAAQDAVREALDLLRQAFSLFGALVPRKASSALRQQLATLEETLVNEEQAAAAFCLSSLSVETQLALTHWLAESQWRQWIDAKGETKLQGSFKRFSDIMLSRVNADLRETFSTVKQPNEYQDKATRLARQLLTIHLLAGSYAPETVASWLEPWQQLLSAIHEKQESGLAWLASQAMKQSPFWLTSGTGR
ncbi:inorganic triphosphatase [Enterobacteriaceae bacterium EKM102V]|uniref:CYTH domain-containing protein n=1 Tax=Pantoea TaxID=53335 RepID=UPI00142DB5C1|nr:MULTISPECIES: inorganic triphosphatase [Pantoea]KAF6656683.1 inorganic triphosphatase [Enterobacteriaceae bacterium EKM102V]KAF6666022.1 inorganic triphosphatase [Pantoea sp. EKM103V]